MTKQLLSAGLLSLAVIQLSSQTVSNPSVEQQAAAYGLDSVDYPGFIYFQEHGTHKDVSNENASPFRYEPPSDGIPLFVSNAGFESGDFTNWTGYIGDNTVSSIGPLQNISPGIYTGSVNPPVADMNARHSIMQLPGAGNDPAGVFPTVPTGYGNNTVRLGNTYSQYQAQAISQTWVVSAQDSFFVISYAVVNYDGTHPVGEGSYFQIDILDSNTNAIFTRHDESQALPSTYLSAGNSTWYLPWEQDTFNLSAYIGQTVTLRFTSSGCIWGGHYCYAYIDCDPNFANTIGINEHSTQSAKVYPNPSADGVYHVTAENPGFENPPVVTDALGREVYAMVAQTPNGWIIDISQSAAGTYFLRTSGESGNSYTTLIK